MRRLPLECRPTGTLPLLLAAGLFGVLPLPAAAQEIPDTPRLRWEFFYQKRAFPFDRIPSGALERARAQSAALRASAFFAPPPISGTQWTAIGPEGIPINGGSIGRLTAIAVHPTDVNTIYVGGAQGGVWKTTNGGASWTALTDAECSLAMGWVAIDPVDPNIVYAGTGEQHFSADSYYGCGVLRSTNGGAGWTQLGGSIFQTSTGGARISRVVIDPSTAGSVATARLFVASDFGLYRSEDGGASFTRVLTGVITDLVMDPNVPSRLYAAAHGTGVYRSLNSGQTWTLQSTGFATAMRRINLAIAPSAPDTLYASVQSTGSDLAGIWRTTDGAATWTQLAATGASCGSQCWYDMTIAVDPTNPTTVYFGGVSLYKSINGGASFTVITNGIHVDQHVLAFAPSDPGLLFVGNDGGIFRSTNAGASWTSLNTNLALTQFYEGISLHPFDPDLVLGGTQDNGTLLYTGQPTWSHVLGGDGGYTAIDAANPLTRYAETQWIASSGYSGPRRSDGGGFVLKTSGITLSEDALFIPPLVMDPLDPTVLYFGTRRVYRTTDRAESWTAISPDLGNRISAIAPALADPSVLYVGLSNGQVFGTDDLGATWTARSYSGSPRYVQDIAVDDRHPLTAWVVTSGFQTTHVFRTTDGGTSFTDVSSNLPDVPVNAIVLDPTDRGTALIGTDLGVFITSDSGGTWTALTSGMPNVAVFDLAYNVNTGTLIAATHGRGMFQLELVRPLTLAVVTGDLADTASVGDTDVRTDSAMVVLSGTDGQSTGWVATGTGASWINLVTATGTGTDRLRWTRDPSGLASGTYVETITVSAGGAIDSPWLIADTLVVQAPLALAVVPTSRIDTVDAGVATAPSDSVDIVLTGDGAATATWSATPLNGTWLSLTTDTGTGSGRVHWDRDPTGLTAGTYVDSISVTAPGALNSPSLVIDTLVVRAPLTLAVVPTSRIDTVEVGTITAPSDSADVVLTGAGAATAAWSATATDGTWLTLTAASGTGSGVVRWDRDPAGLAAGIYVDTISVAAPGALNSPAVVIDTLVVIAPVTLAVVPASRSDSTLVGSTVLLPDSADVVLTGSSAGTAAWTATHGGGTWLTLTAASGTGSGVVRWDRDPSALTVGVYVDTVSVTVAGAEGSPALLIDSLVVLGPLTLALTPTLRMDTAVVGATTLRTDSASVDLSGAGSTTAAWTATHGSGGWLTLTTAAGVGSATVRWQRDPTGLAPGWHVDTVTVTATGAVGSPAAVVDSLLVQPGPAAIALVPTGTRDSLSIGATIPLPDSASVALTGVVADTTQWTATHGAAAWLALTTAAGTGSGMVRWQRSATGLALGSYVDTVVVVTSAAETATLTDTLEIIPPPLTASASSRGAAAVSGSLAPQADSVALTLRGVGNTTATWVATHGQGAWIAITASTGTGDGTVRWTRDPAGLRPGVYVDTLLVATSRADTAAIIDTLTLTTPAVVANCAAAELLGTVCLNDVQRRYLDLDGNADGTYNLGDLVALLRRPGAPAAAERRR